MKTINYHQLAKLTTFASFSLGTILFIKQKMANDLSLVNIGISYILIAVIVNSLLLLAIIREAFIHKRERSSLLLSGALLLANIPIAFIYLINL